MVKVNIIGAGILGASAAYELTRKGHDVTIADNWMPGRATYAAAGIICPWISKRRNMSWYALAEGGAAYYPSLIKQLEQDGETSTGFEKVGAIRLHHDIDKLLELEALARKRKEVSPEIGDIQLLNKEEAFTAFPYTEEEFHALFISGAARVDGHALSNALLRNSQKHGASFIQGKASLSLTGTHVTGMDIEGTSYPADMTLAVNGVWMNQLLEPLKPNIHFQAQKGELLHLEMNETTDTAKFPVVQPPNNQYILPLGENKLIAGSTHETAHHFDPSLSAKGAHYILDQLFKMTPGIQQQARITDVRVGFRPFTKNHLPVFGPLPGYEGLLIANGLGASGLTTGPFIGKQLAKMITGETTDVPISNYNIRLGE